MFRKRIELHCCAPSFECVATNFVSRFNTMSSKRLVTSTRQDPATVFRKDYSRDSSIVCKIFFDRSQPITVFRQQKLRNCSILLSDEERSRFWHIIWWILKIQRNWWIILRNLNLITKLTDGRTLRWHKVNYARPVGSRVSFHPYTNCSASGDKRFDLIE